MLYWRHLSGIAERSSLDLRISDKATASVSYKIESRHPTVEVEDMISMRQSKAATAGVLIAVWFYSVLTVDFSQGQAMKLSPALPADVMKTGVKKSDFTQADFDNFAWQVFVALNWPTKAGHVDTQRIIGQAPQAARVWELFTDPMTILQNDENNQILSLSVPKESKLLYLPKKRIEKLTGSDYNADEPQNDLQAGSNWPLIDQNRNYAIYEIRINDTETNYITSNGLTSHKGLKDYKRPIVFPAGSIEVKAAWRILPGDTPQKIKQRYHVRKALIAISKENSATGAAFQIEATVGLVGLHITYKTKSQPRWVWATFEQVDNYEVPASLGFKPTFSNGEADPADANKQPMPAPPKNGKYLWSPTLPTAGKYTPTQVARCPNEVELPSAVNAKWQKLLASVPGVENSLWQYYRLNAVQWFDGPTLLPKNNDKVAVSRNSVLETYLLGDQTIASQVPAVGPVNDDPNIQIPNSTLADTIIATINAGSANAQNTYTWSSCVLCHQMALYQYGTKREVVMTDYSFVFKSYLPLGAAQQKRGQ